MADFVKVLPVSLYNMLPARHRKTVCGVHYAVINGHWFRVRFEHTLPKAKT